MKTLLATTAFALALTLPAFAAGTDQTPKVDSVTGSDITDDASKQADGHAADAPKADSVTGADITDDAANQAEGYAADAPKADSVTDGDIKTESN